MSTIANTDAQWMKRCIDLARQGLGQVSPNPPVGAVLVHNNTILAEGYHTQFGLPHAEVEALNAVPLDKRYLIQESTLYVSLEPCCITGKTPPCTERIIREGIKEVCISIIDPNPAVSGLGIKALQAQGITVRHGVLQEEGEHLIRTFRTNILFKRPHVILKWAQSKFGIFGVEGTQVWFSQSYTQSWSHQVRAEFDSIMVGARTVETDNPSLTTRDYPGRSPQRIVYDPQGRLDHGHKVFKNDGVPVYHFTTTEAGLLDNVEKVKLTSADHVREMLHFLFQKNIGSVIIEGGAHLHQMFIDANLWDEAWVVQTQHELDAGIRAPNVRGSLLEKFSIGSDIIVGIRNVVS